MDFVIRVKNIPQIGETVIGKGSVIGGNAFITESVPAGTRVSVKNPELSFSTKKSHNKEELPR